jgi:aldose 1-epimerase
VRPLPADVALDQPTGSQFVLRRGGQRAVVTEVGATLRSWSVDDIEQLDTVAAGEAGTAFRGKVLVPWPNRVRDGRFRFAGEEHQLAVTEPGRATALHGLALWSNWRLLRRGPGWVVLGHVLRPQPGYPFMLGLEVEYWLVDGGVTVALRATNLGAEAAPFGAGFHPYVTVGTRVDEARLEVPAGLRLPVDGRLLPAGRPAEVEGTLYDFRRARRIGGQALDTCFGELWRGADGVARVRLAAADGQRSVTVWMDERFRYVHVYTSDADPDPARRRRSVAIEPMTCAPDAFNNGLGLATLAPGSTFSARWGMTGPG